MRFFPCRANKTPNRFIQEKENYLFIPQNCRYKSFLYPPKPDLGKTFKTSLHRLQQKTHTHTLDLVVVVVWCRLTASQSAIPSLAVLLAVRKRTDTGRGCRSKARQAAIPQRKKEKTEHSTAHRARGSLPAKYCTPFYRSIRQQQRMMILCM